MAAAVPDGVPPDATEIARGTLGGATAVAEGLPDPLGAALLDSARNAFVQAFEVTAAVNAVLVLAAAIAATLMLRRAQSVRRENERSAA